MPYFRLVVEYKASDLFLYPDAPVSIKINGRIRSVGEERVSAKMVEQVILSLLNEEQKKEFAKELELNFALHFPDLGRFRVNVFMQRGEMGMVARYINATVPNIQELSLPPLLLDLVMEKRGLILVVGATGSGKSTTLAAMISHRAAAAPGHILTIEDPIEYIYEHDRAIIGQREVGLDTHSYENALQSAMREAPDVILVGEVRNRTVMRATLNFSVTGHLCLTTLHANNAPSALDRIVNFFPEDAREQLLADLSLNLRAIISQRLVRDVNNKLVPAVEVMLNTPFISELIEKGELGRLQEAMENGGTTGMKTFDQALVELYEAGRITEERAIEHADSKNNVSLKIRLSKQRAPKRDDEQSTRDLRLQGQRRVRT